MGQCVAGSVPEQMVSTCGQLVSLNGHSVAGIEMGQVVGLLGQVVWPNGHSVGLTGHWVNRAGQTVWLLVPAATQIVTA
jgi:hypothetical protein